MVSPVRYIDIEYRLSIVDISTLLKYIDIDIDIVIFENIDMAILKILILISIRQF